jgi:hypothetical protein
MSDQPVARPLPTHRTNTNRVYAQTSMPRIVFEPTIPAFKRTKTVHALDRAATVIGPVNFTLFKWCRRALTRNEKSDPCTPAYVHITPSTYMWLNSHLMRHI